MGGKIIEFSWEKPLREAERKGLNAGREEGRKEGRREGKLKALVELAHDKDIDFDIAADKAMKEYNITREEFKDMVDTYAPDDTDDELLQG